MALLLTLILWLDTALLTPKSYTADLKRIYGRRDGILDGNERTSDTETLQKIRKNIVQRFGPDPLVHNRHQGEHH